MKVELIKLLQRIEDSRQKMNDFAKDKSLSDPTVVNISNELDILLNEYHALNEYSYPINQAQTAK